MTLARRRSAHSALRWTLPFALILDLFALAHAHAQAQPLRPYAEVRGEGIIAPTSSGLLGGGAQIPLGFYARLGLDVSGGVAHEHDASFAAARGDAIVRFLIDPFRESPWALSAGAGVSVAYQDPITWRAFLAVVLDVEGRRAGGITPAFQVGLGGGVRLGMALRFSQRAYR